MLKRFIFQLVVSLVMAGSVCAAGPTINLGVSSGSAGRTVTVPISLTGNGSSMTAISMDIGYDPAALGSPVAVLSSALVSAGFSLASGTPSAGVFRIGVYNLSNPKAIGDGGVVNVTFTLAAGESLGTVITVANTPAASDALGNPVLATGANGSVTVIALSGDCNNDGTVSPGEFTSSINRFMGRAAGGTACTAFYNTINMTPGYFTKVINAVSGR